MQIFFLDPTATDLDPKAVRRIEDFLLALERDPSGPAWRVGDRGHHPVMGAVTVARVDGSGAFPRYLCYPDDGREGGWISGAFLS